MKKINIIFIKKSKKIMSNLVRKIKKKNASSFETSNLNTIYATLNKKDKNQILEDKKKQSDDIVYATLDKSKLNSPKKNISNASKQEEKVIYAQVKDTKNLEELYAKVDKSRIAKKNKKNPEEINENLKKTEVIYENLKKYKLPPKTAPKPKLTKEYIQKLKEETQKNNEAKEKLNNKNKDRYL